MFVSAGDRAGRKFPGLTYWIENYSVSAPNATIPVVSFTVKNILANQAYTDVDAAVVPVARGGFATAIADGTAVGGNKRGLYSTDTQLRRASATQVAATDYGALIAGRNNLLSNSVANTLFYAGIFVGFGNSITASSGGSGLGHVILGGSGNSITDSGATVASGAIGGNTIAITCGSGVGGQFAGGGLNNNLTGNQCFAIGGRNCDSTNTSGGTFGEYAKTRTSTGMIAYGCNGGVGSQGSVQGGMYTLGRTTNDATPVPLTTSGGAATNANQLGAIPANTAFAFRGIVLCNKASTAAASWEVNGLARNSGGTITMVGVTVTAGPIDAALAGVAVAVTADTANLSIATTVTGLAATPLGWTAFYWTAEHM